MMKTKVLNQSRAAQQLRLLLFLKENGAITTLQARQLLSVMHPAGRIKDLKNKGFCIETSWVTDIDSAGATHRQGIYTLKMQNKKPTEVIEL